MCVGSLPERQKKLWGTISTASALKCRARIRNDWNAEKCGEGKGQKEAGWFSWKAKRFELKRRRRRLPRLGRVEMFIRLEVKSHLTGFSLDQHVYVLLAAPVTFSVSKNEYSPSERRERLVEGTPAQSVAVAQTGLSGQLKDRSQRPLSDVVWRLGSRAAAATTAVAAATCSATNQWAFERGAFLRKSKTTTIDAHIK